MRTSRLLTGPGPLEPDGTPLGPRQNSRPDPDPSPPPTQMELRLDKQTPVKTLPCPKLRLQAVIIVWWKFHWVACWGVSGVSVHGEDVLASPPPMSVQTTQTVLTDCQDAIRRSPPPSPKRQNQPPRQLYEPPIIEHVNHKVKTQWNNESVCTTAS